MDQERELGVPIIKGQFAKHHNLLLLMCDDQQFRFIDVRDIEATMAEPVRILTSGKPELMKIGRRERNMVISDSKGWINVY